MILMISFSYLSFSSPLYNKTFLFEDALISNASILEDKLKFSVFNVSISRSKSRQLSSIKDISSSYLFFVCSNTLSFSSNCLNASSANCLYSSLSSNSLNFDCKFILASFCLLALTSVGLKCFFY